MTSDELREKAVDVVTDSICVDYFDIFIRSKQLSDFLLLLLLIAVRI